MKATLHVPKNAIETEAEDHAAETRNAVTRREKDQHPQPPARRAPARSADRPEEPWQVD